MEAYDAGQRILKTKFKKWRINEQMPKDIKWHMIGHVDK
jgi:uncharacterized pyridoxal phosphate-containing UPF0001 family protein